MNERIQNVCPWERTTLKKKFLFYIFYLCLLIQYNYLSEHIFAKRIICKIRMCSSWNEWICYLIMCYTNVALFDETFYRFLKLYHVWQKYFLFVGVPHSLRDNGSINICSYIFPIFFICFLPFLPYFESIELRNEKKSKFCINHVY